MSDDPVNAFVPGPRCRIAGSPNGPLAGLRFAVKDLIDVAGWPTGGGNPDWERAHAVPTRHAPVVERLLQAGASVVGKTLTDEVSLGILGENPFYGTPINPSAPGRVPGGSSSGSASAAASRLCDFALGTDTGGSVRAPACAAGLTGSPQVTLPVARVDGAPVGLSIIAGRGGDLELLAVVRAFPESPEL